MHSHPRDGERFDPWSAHLPKCTELASSEDRVDSKWWEGPVEMSDSSETGTWDLEPGCNAGPAASQNPGRYKPFERTNSEGHQGRDVCGDAPLRKDGPDPRGSKIESGGGIGGGGSQGRSVWQDSRLESEASRSKIKGEAEGRETRSVAHPVFRGGTVDDDWSDESFKNLHLRDPAGGEKRPEEDRVWAVASGCEYPERGRRHQSHSAIHSYGLDSSGTHFETSQWREKVAGTTPGETLPLMLSL